MKLLRITLLIAFLLFAGTIAGCLEGSRADWPDPFPHNQSGSHANFQIDLNDSNEL